MTVKAASPQQLGKRVRRLRQQRGLSQEQLAEPDYTAAYISHIEHGKRRASQAVLTHIAERLEMTLEQLMTGRDPYEDLRLEVQIQQAFAEIHQGRAKEALSVLEESRQKAIDAGNRRATELAESGLGLALYRLGSIEEALSLYERALEGSDPSTPELRTSTLAGKARCLFQLGEMRDAIHLLESHLIDLQRSDVPDPGCLVETYAALIPVYFESGLIERAKEAAIKGWELAPRIPNIEQRACLYVNRAQLLLTQGEPREALASLALAADLYHHLGWHSEVVKVSLARTFVLTDQGALDEAERLIREALDASDHVVDQVDEVRALTRLALIRRLKGFPKEGLELAGRAVKLAGGGFRNSAAEAMREAGLCSMALGDSETALGSWRRALKAFLETGDHEEAAKTARLAGEFLIQQGDFEGAAAIFRQGLQAVEQLQ